MGRLQETSPRNAMGASRSGSFTSTSSAVPDSSSSSVTKQMPPALMSFVSARRTLPVLTTLTTAVRRLMTRMNRRCSSPIDHFRRDYGEGNHGYEMVLLSLLTHVRHDRRRLRERFRHLMSEVVRDALKIAGLHRREG